MDVGLYWIGFDWMRDVGLPEFDMLYHLLGWLVLR